MAEKSSDPVAVWQTMISEMEKGFNAFANRAMESPEFSEAMNRAGGISAGAQKQLQEFIEKYLLTLNLPSRGLMVSMAERLQSMEAQLNEIKALLEEIRAASGAPPSGQPARAKPPRTKRPPASGREQT